MNLPATYHGDAHRSKNNPLQCRIRRKLHKVKGSACDDPVTLHLFLFQMLEEEGRKGITGWVSGWLGGSRVVQSVPTTPQRPTSTQNLNGVSVSQVRLKTKQNRTRNKRELKYSAMCLVQSFSEMFVKFLEVESTPTAPAPKLPVYDIKPLNAPPAGRNTAGAPAAGTRTVHACCLFKLLGWITRLPVT